MTITTTEREPTVGPSDTISPAPIMSIASGFMAAKHLFAANELGLFEALADSPTRRRPCPRWPRELDCRTARPGSAPTRWSDSACSSATVTSTATPR